MIVYFVAEEGNKQSELEKNMTKIMEDRALEALSIHPVCIGEPIYGDWDDGCLVHGAGGLLLGEALKKYNKEE